MKERTTLRKEIKMTVFTKTVIAVVKKIPRGKVATYGQIARLAGKPGAARGVGWILNSCAESHGLPWQRVLNSQGRISFKPRSEEAREQKRLLEREGVRFLDRGLSLDLAKYRWKREPRPQKSARTPSLFS